MKTLYKAATHVISKLKASFLTFIFFVVLNIPQTLAYKCMFFFDTCTP